MGNCPSTPITPTNSPYTITGGTTDCDKITINGGWLQLQEFSNFNIKTLEISAGGALKGKQGGGGILSVIKG